MSRWIEITGTNKADLKAKAKKVQDKLHELLSITMGNNYNAGRYAKLGSSIRLHKTELKVIIKIPDTVSLRWEMIKKRIGEVPGWVTPKNIDRGDPNYFNNDV